jgi:hypothetical protein
VGGLGHTFESQGIPTTQISLVREHTAVIKPPRALWVSFELGRPFGSPNDPAFQREVALSALALLEETAGPVLRDFPKDAPEVARVEEDEWACPISLPAADVEKDSLALRFRTEFAALRPWYETALRERGGTTFGAAGLSIEGLGSFVEAVAEGAEEVPADVPEREFAGLLKLVSEDLRALYLEALAAQPARRQASSKELSGWFFQETAAGELFHELAAGYRKREDPALQLLGNILLVPVDQSR